MLNNFLSATALAATSEAIAFGASQGIDMKTILDIVNASTGRNSATDDKFPTPHHARQLRRRLHRQAAAEGHPPLSGERARRRHPRRDRQRRWWTCGAWTRTCPARTSPQMYPLHAEGTAAQAASGAARCPRAPGGNHRSLADVLRVPRQGFGPLQQDATQIGWGKGDKAMPSGWNLETLRKRQRSAGQRAAIEPLAGVRGLQARAAHAPGRVRAGHRRPGAALQRVPLHATRSRCTPPTSGRALRDRPRVERRYRSRDHRHHHHAGDARHLAGPLLYEDFADFYAQAKEAFRSRPWNVVLIGANRQQLVNTRVPWGTPLPISTRQPGPAAYRKGDPGAPRIGPVFRGTSPSS